MFPVAKNIISHMLRYPIYKGILQVIFCPGSFLHYDIFYHWIPHIIISHWNNILRSLQLYQFHIVNQTLITAININCMTTYHRYYKRLQLKIKILDCFHCSLQIHKFRRECDPINMNLYINIPNNGSPVKKYQEPIMIPPCLIISHVWGIKKYGVTTMSLLITGMYTGIDSLASW